MELEEIETSIPAVLLSEETSERSPGLHLSHILDSIEEALYGDRYADHPWNGQTTMGVGFLWERVLTDQLATAATESGTLMRLGEVEVDGIIGTPDGLNPDLMVPEEWKCTWKSLRRDITSEAFVRYWWQIKSYCHMLDVTQYILRVLYVVGDYRGSGPEWRSWLVTFTEREIADNWTMVLNHKKAKGW